MSVSPPITVPVVLVAGTHREELAKMLPEFASDVSAEGTSTPPAKNRVVLVDFDGLDRREFAGLSRAAVDDRQAIVVLAEPTAPGLDAFIADYASHYLPRPFLSADLGRVLRLAQRQLGRLQGLAERRLRRSRALAVQTEDGARERIAERLVTLAEPLVVLLVAFTRFEMINTAFGRETGDVLLEAVAGRIEPLVAECGGVPALLGRMGGAEFVVTVEGIDRAGQENLANRIVQQVERPFFVEGHMVTLGCRIGMVESAAGDNATRLLQRAGAALSLARASEGSPVRMLTAADEDAALFHATLETDLRIALDRDEVEILFQPQLSVASGAIVGVEALARWRHPDHGELGAATLFAVAERSDYLTVLSGHIQKRAAAQAAAWPPALSHLRLAINLTAADIARAGFVDMFFAMIAESGFPRDRLTVEITESVLIEDLNAASNVLAKLRARGCCVAIDDFGTGYSSLAYLKALPLDYLKIDKHLAQDITGSARDRVVVRGVIDMARSLGLAVVAEGVETEEQLALLAAAGCNLYQGFLFAEAMGVDDLIRLISREPVAPAP